jgi:hypothetical protein
MDPGHDRPLDLLVDRFTMCHTLDLRDRLTIDPLTVPLADLLLTKLQVFEINEKDLLDLTALVSDHPLDAADGTDPIDARRVVDVLSRDWGFEHTVRANLERLSAFATERVPGELADRVGERVARLDAALETASKSVGWKVRARVGERVRWYELPEDVRH